MTSSIPFSDFDIGVHGGTLAGVSAALELKRRGFRVWLSTHRSYLGEDLCDPLRLLLPSDLDTREGGLDRIFPEDAVREGFFRPMALKQALDRLILEADIPLFLDSAPGEIFANGAGQVCGLSLCDRSGRRLLTCRALLDATVAGDLVRMANVPLTPPSARVAVVRRVIGGESADPSGWVAEGRVRVGEGEDILWAHRSVQKLGGPGWGDWMELEQRVRMAAHRPGQTLSADGIEAFTGERLRPDMPPETDAASPDACSALARSLWVAGDAANVTAEQREHLRRPDAAWARGNILATRIAEQLPVSADGECHSLSAQRLPDGVSAMDVALPGGGLPQDSDALCAVEEVDVLVVGGGTGGAPAGLAAARSGAKTLVTEFLSGLGGVGTLGLIGKYWFGVREGFTAEVDEGVKTLTPRDYKEGSWDVEAKMQWYHREIEKAGGKIWYKTLFAGALRAGDRVAGAVLCTPRGRVAVLARCSVDATGSAGVAAAAGAPTVPVGDGHLALQGTGLPPRTPGQHYANTDYEFVDDSSASDHASAHLAARAKFRNAFDAGQLVDSRERRRIVGDIEVSPMDIRLARVFPDTICRARSNFDTHGFTVHPLFLVVTPGHDPVDAHIPLRALLPAGLEGVLVTGLGISAHRDAMPVIRMQADVQNQGYAAGLIAAMAPDGCIRALDLARVQEPLLAKGILTPELFRAGDSFPLPEAEVECALSGSVTNPDLVDRVFTLPLPERLEKLRKAYAAADGLPGRRHFAFVLAVLGDATGAETLATEVAESPWDEGWDYRGMGQFGASMSPLDARIIALGRCRQPETFSVFEHMAASLPAVAAFSHYRALAEAFATLGDPRGAAPLDALLQRPGIRGHALTSADARMRSATDSWTETSLRNNALIELSLAAALYRLDSASATAMEVLRTYAGDVRGLFARHARDILCGPHGNQA